ncbi:MAG: type II toxin-antitoxin system RelE/ParE family toxin [Methylococcales bacterium]|nr:type II toxin-antitoxin system RelE/ParE family toxin [Methylococcales bacterium]
MIENHKRIFKTRYFSNWLEKTELTDALLLNAVEEMERGLIDADLGGGVFKKRVALPNRGKSGSVRTLIATNKNDRWFFMFGFEKNQRDNIDKSDLKFLKQAAKKMLSFSDELLDITLQIKELEEIHYVQKN